MGFPNIPDNQVEVIPYHVTEIFIITDMGGLQHFQMGVIFAGAIPFNDFMPDGIDKGVEVLNLHGGNPIHINLNVNNRFVCYDIRELGKQLKKLGMLIVQDQVWNRVTINRAQHKATRYYMDEFHLLLKEEQTAAYSVEIWKRFRKWGGIPTGITQNVKDLLASREVENIFENSDFVYLLNQASGDRQILSKALNISPSQQNYITNSNAGEGLIFYGSTIVPFKDDFPKDTQLYRIMTTKPEETVQN